MPNKIELSLLTDYYGAFLTDNQRELILMSVDNDFSLSEIAERRGISKQGVRDALLRGEKLLRDMESKLGLISRDRKILELTRELKTELTDFTAAAPRDAGNGRETAARRKVKNDCGNEAGSRGESESLSRVIALLNELIKITEGTDGV